MPEGSHSTAMLALGIGSMLHQLRAKNAELEARVGERTAELEADGDPASLLAAADAALYEARAAGCNRVVLSGKSRHSLPNSLPTDGARE